eukprot:NODE_6802_length_488_cov_54.232346_g6009_i0.p1 GENE.NODE_6802_length_488_cov_54.232346_g6009_i0~~NODE_6802_length_488_cov_54.232346_g6009_i0.p1  ORF type:complete len:121 (+),score=42.11 NODE_6802_length_488_cov_54.232346_g6009_i0:23-364(+)
MGLDGEEGVADAMYTKDEQQEHWAYVANAHQDWALVDIAANSPKPEDAAELRQDAQVLLTLASGDPVTVPQLELTKHNQHAINHSTAGVLLLPLRMQHKKMHDDDLRRSWSLQ